MKKIVSTLFVGFIYVAIPSQGQAVQLDGNEISIHHLESKNCEECHKKIYKQWKGSMHAQSVATKDPIHGAFYRKVIGDPTKEGVTTKSGKYPVCLQCHAPNAARDQKTKLDSNPAYSEGVNCVVCHTLKTFKGINLPNGKMQLGLSAYTTATQLQGPNGFLHEQGSAAEALREKLDKSGDLNPHLGYANDGKPYMAEKDMKEINFPLEKNSMMKTSSVCLGCHDKRNNSHGVSLCQTGDEYREGKSRETCQSCHMPVSDGIVDHSMGGGHSLPMLKRAVRLDMKTTSVGDKLQIEVVLENQQPHSVPTGAPFRNAYVKITALSINGDILWQNFKQRPLEDPQAYLVYTMLDDKGNPAPPPKATKVGKNTRLKPYELRTLSYEIPRAGIDSVRAELYYNLLWPNLAKNIKGLPDELKAPKLIGWAEDKIQ